MALTIARPGAVVLLLLMCSMLGACESTAQPRAQTTDPSASVPTVQGPRIVRRTLDFSQTPRSGRALYRLPFGKGAKDLGFAPICMHASCALPCPCTVPIQPPAVDVGSAGRVRVLDIVNSRVATYSKDSRFLYATSDPTLGPRAFDVQVVGPAAVAMGQDYNFRPVFTVIRSRRVESVQTLHWRHSDSARWLTGASGKIFTRVFTRRGKGEEVPIEVFPSRDSLDAKRRPGIPFLDGWFLFRPYLAAQAIPLAVSSSSQRWSEEIHFGMRRGSGDGKHQVRGVVSWENEVAPDGTIYLLLFAGTESSPRSLDGFWFLRVDPDGTVGTPIPVRGPTRSQDDQGRHMSLDANGRPLLAWARRRVLRIELAPTS